MQKLYFPASQTSIGSMVGWDMATESALPELRSSGIQSFYVSVIWCVSWLHRWGCCKGTEQHSIMLLNKNSLIKRELENLSISTLVVLAFYFQLKVLAESCITTISAELSLPSIACCLFHKHRSETLWDMSI